MSDWEYLVAKRHPGRLELDDPPEEGFEAGEAVVLDDAGGAVELDDAGAVVFWRARRGDGLASTELDTPSSASVRKRVLESMAMGMGFGGRMGDQLSSRACTAYISRSHHHCAPVNIHRVHRVGRTTPFTVSVSSENINPTRRARGNHVGRKRYRQVQCETLDPKCSPSGPDDMLGSTSSTSGGGHPSHDWRPGLGCQVAPTWRVVHRSGRSTG